MFSYSRSWGKASTLFRGASQQLSSSSAELASKKNGEHIFQASYNKVMRYVYLRTLPLAKHPQLTDIVEELAEEIKTSTSRLCDKYAHRITDDRSKVHLHMGALAIASYKVLSPRVKNETVLINMIRGGFGAKLIEPSTAENAHVMPKKKAEPMSLDYWITKFATWFSLDRMNAVRKMTANMQRDFGSSFQTELLDHYSHESTENAGDVHRLVVRKCFYNSLCRDEGLPQLTKIFCALDKALFAPIKPSTHGIKFALEETLADSSEKDGENSKAKCNFVFTRIPKEK